MALMTFTEILSAINILLIVVLVYIYFKSYIRMKSGFTLGLLLFSLLFLVHNALYLYFALTMMPYYSQSLGLYGFIFTLLQTLAFASLAWVAWK